MTDEYNLVYPAISSMLREVAADLEPEEVGMIALWAAMQKKAQGKKTNDMEVSAFASRNLSEEFFLYVMDFFADEVDTMTEDQVMVGDDIKDGEVVELALGSYVDLDNEDRWVKSVKDLNGDFTITKKENGRWVARRNFLNLIDVPESSNELVFTTKMNPKTMKNAKEMIDGMRGKMVYLVPYLKGTDYHDAIVVDGTVVGEFKCSVGKHSDKGAVAKSNAATNKLLSKLYRKKGVVKFFDFKAAGNGLQAIVCLENVEEYDDSEVKISKSLIVETPAKEDKAPRKRGGFKAKAVGKAFLGDEPVKAAPKKAAKAEVKAEAEPKKKAGFKHRPVNKGDDSIIF